MANLDSLLTAQAVLEGLGHAALIFDSAGKLIMVNQAARVLLGRELRALQTAGWLGAVGFFDRFLGAAGETLEDIRQRALVAERPIHFHIHRSGELITCWISTLHGTSGEIFILVGMQTPDWTVLADTAQHYMSEVVQTVEATSGHAALIEQSLRSPRPSQTLDQLQRRIGGFNRLILIHMHRLQRLTTLIARLHAIQSGLIHERIRADRRKIVLSDFMEDFIETIDEIALLDPETEPQRCRARLRTIIPPYLTIDASPHYVTLILRDIVRNAIMYSMRNTPVTIVAFAGSREATVQIDITDEGCGVRLSEHSRVFAPFQRAQQPQIISEFGYGLSLYLCKCEIEAMDGLMWFESQEGSGTTISLRLPAWREDSALPGSASA